MIEFFHFEVDFVDSLRCIPMQVRMKLDTCGIKLKLSDWNHLTRQEREALLELPCTSETEIQAYRQFLHKLTMKHTGALASSLPVDPAPAWMDTTNVPQSIQQKAQEVGATVTQQQWEALHPLQRFALIKLSRSSHENHNFLPALKEFHIA